jgi:hypothetical protein
VPLVAGLLVIGAGVRLVVAGASEHPRPRLAALDLTVPSTTTTTTTTVAPPSNRPADGRADGSSGVAPIGTRDALLASAPPEAGNPPVGITLERVGKTAVVAAVGLDAVGGVEVPADVTVAGWYRFGPAPGDGGSAVIVAHVDFDGREGPFYRLADLQPGDIVTVDRADGSTARFAVSQRGQYRKQDLPTADLFRTGGPPQLVLITCGGEFEDELHTYADNVVVVAVPTP